MDILAHVTRQAEAWESMGRPAMIERLCIMRGKPMQGQPWKRKRWAQKMCFSNAAAMSTRSNGRAVYVEGLAMRPDLGILIHHAWCVEDGKVIDPTWERPETAFYLGVEVPHDTLWKRLLETEVYGLFNTGGMIPVEWLCEFEPRLVPYWEQYKRKGLTT